MGFYADNARHKCARLLTLTLTSCFACDVIAGTTTAEGHHYRASRMALWLDLIPKLHRADGHDDGFDQLGGVDEDPDSPLAYDLVAVVPPPPSSSTSDGQKPPTVATSTLATYSARKLFLRSPAPTSSRSPVSVDARPAAKADSRTAKTLIAPPAALAATLLIGCLALVVNCVIFVVVYRRRVSLKRLPPPTTSVNNTYPPSPSVNVVGAPKSSATDVRCADGVMVTFIRYKRLYDKQTEVQKCQNYSLLCRL